MSLATILIVDDNPTNLKLATRVLECDDYTIALARNVDEAREVLKLINPDLILMDLQMPGMDGLTFTRLLKASPLYRDIPVVALTAFAMKGDEDKAREAGCSTYITKPIDTRKFPILVATILADAAKAKIAKPEQSLR